MAEEINPYTSALTFFGAELRKWRTDIALSGAQLGEALGCTPQWISQLERGKKLPSEASAVDLDTYFKTNGIFWRLWRLIKEGISLALPPGFPRFIELEARANAMRIFEALLITGLLQTEEYAREVLLTVQQPDAVEPFVATRMERQAVLSRANPPRLWVTYDEGALRHVMGSAEVMRGQLRHLLDASNRPNIMLQVVPQSTCGYAGREGSCTLLSFDEGPDAAYIEAVGRGQLIESPNGVADCHVRYDLIRGYALPVAESRELIKSILESL